MTITVFDIRFEVETIDNYDQVKKILGEAFKNHKVYELTLLNED